MQEFNELKLLRGEDYKINEAITIHHPRLKEICEIGEEKYFSVLHTLTATSSDCKSLLDDIGIDYMQIDDYSLFLMLSRNLKYDDTWFFLGDLDLSTMEVVYNKSIGENVLYNAQKHIVLDRVIYELIVRFLRKIHKLKRNVDIAGNELTRRILIDEERNKIKRSAKKGYKSQLASLISGMTNYAGFKYDLYNIWDLSIYAFMDAVQRVLKIYGNHFLMTGIYTGNIERDKVSKKDLDWLGELE